MRLPEDKSDPIDPFAKIRRVRIVLQHLLVQEFRLMPGPFAGMIWFVVHVENVLALNHGVLRLTTPRFAYGVLSVSNGLVEWVELGVVQIVDIGILAIFYELTGGCPD